MRHTSWMLTVRFFCKLSRSKGYDVKEDLLGTIRDAWKKVEGMRDCQSFLDELLGRTQHAYDSLILLLKPGTTPVYNMSEHLMATWKVFGKKLVDLFVLGDDGRTPSVLWLHHGAQARALRLVL